MRTVADRLDITRGRPAGFDYLRLGLAISIFVFHCVQYVMLPAMEYRLANSGWRVLSAGLVPMFFALSGFLVAGSLERSASLVNFLGLRGLRIFPALAVEVVLSALILGPIMTSGTLGSYFHSSQFGAYFLNIFGDIHYYLPGVFSHNPNNAKINGQLWTVPFELECYLTLAVLAVLGIARRRTIFLWSVIALQAVWVVDYIHKWGVFKNVAGPTTPGHTLVVCFLAGVLLYSFREKVIWSAPLAALAGLVSILMLLNPGAGTLLALPIAYLTAYLGLLNPKRIAIMETGDYSYGIYLFSVPIQQTVIALGEWTHHWWIVLLIAGPIAGGFAAFSWHGIEKHALKLRVQLKQIESRYLVARSAIASRYGFLTRPFMSVASLVNQKIRPHRPTLDDVA